MNDEFNVKQQISIYLQKLLAAQYKVSANIEHRPTKGELREVFIKNIICKEFRERCFYRGILEFDHWQSPEIDFIWLKNNARVGTFHVFNGTDCKLFMEIKSRAKKEEIEYLNQYSQKIKEHCLENSVKAGMFAYSTSVSRNSILKDFGFIYDKTLKGFEQYNGNKDRFPYIDFVFGLDLQNNKPRAYLMVRDYYGKMTLILKEPVIDYFLDLFKE